MPRGRSTKIELPLNASAFQRMVFAFVQAFGLDGTARRWGLYRIENGKQVPNAARIRSWVNLKSGAPDIDDDLARAAFAEGLGTAAFIGGLAQPDGSHRELLRQLLELLGTNYYSSGDGQATPVDGGPIIGLVGLQPNAKRAG